MTINGVIARVNGCGNFADEVYDEAGCTKRACTVRLTYDHLERILLIQHGPNREALMELTPMEIAESPDPGYCANKYIDWAKRVHEYDDRRSRR